MNKELKQLYILNHFTNKAEPNRNIKRYVIYTYDRSKAINIMESVIKKDKDNVLEYRFGLYPSLRLKDGSCYNFYHPNMCMRGIKYSHVWIDLDIELDIIKQIIIPSGIYCSKSNVEFI